jgi:hypothetical protein
VTKTRSKSDLVKTNTHLHAALIRMNLNITIHWLPITYLASPRLASPGQTISNDTRFILLSPSNMAHFIFVKKKKKNWKNWKNGSLFIPFWTIFFFFLTVCDFFLWLWWRYFTVIIKHMRAFTIAKDKEIYSSYKKIVKCSYKKNIVFYCRRLKKAVFVLVVFRQYLKVRRCF